MRVARDLAKTSPEMPRELHKSYQTLKTLVSGFQLKLFGFMLVGPSGHEGMGRQDGVCMLHGIRLSFSWSLALRGYLVTEDVRSCCKPRAIQVSSCLGRQCAASENISPVHRQLLTCQTAGAASDTSRRLAHRENQDDVPSLFEIIPISGQDESCRRTYGTSPRLAPHTSPSRNNQSV